MFLESAARDFGGGMSARPDKSFPSRLKGLQLFEGTKTVLKVKGSFPLPFCLCVTVDIELSLLKHLK